MTLIKFPMNGTEIEAQADELIRVNEAMKTNDLVLVAIEPTCELGVKVMTVAGGTIVERVEVRADGTTMYLFACGRVPLADSIAPYQPDVAATLRVPPASDRRWMMRVTTTGMTVVEQTFAQLGIA